jgi:hypothetical protein
MGRESKVEYVDAGGSALVKAHLDSMNLELTGAKKLKLPLGQVKAATVEADALKIVAGKTKFSLKLGRSEAELWRKKILNPPSLTDKLGFKPDKAVLLIGKVPPEIVSAANGIGATRSAQKMPKELVADIIVLALSPGKEEAQIALAARTLNLSQALWLIYEKGLAFNGDNVIAVARAARLKDTKVARVSDTHTGLRFIR